MKNEILPYASSDHHQLFSFGISSMNESIPSWTEVPAAHIDSTVLNLYGRNSFMSCIDSSSYNNNQYNFAIPPLLLPMDYQSAGLSSIIMTSKRPDYHYAAAAAAVGGGYRPPKYCNYDIDDSSSLVLSKPFPKKKLSVQPLLHFNDIQAIRNPRKRPLEVTDKEGSMIIMGSDYKAVANQWKTKKKRIHHPKQKPSQDKIQETVLEIPREKLPAVRRSQKLSDKITALQKLVSPYGKADTASVLEEAYISIKLLQDQIQNLFNKLSSSSIDHTKPLQYQKMTEERQSDLRKRGMCLVSVSFTQRLRKLQETSLNQRRLSVD